MDLTRDDRLPLTCTRSGACCHGPEIWLNPWELACLARGAGQPAEAVIATSTTHDGRRLRLDGPPDGAGRPACHWYADGLGCTLHPHRPLACRLFPLGRQRDQGQVRYHHAGSRLPCHERCPEVTDLPWLTVGDYLEGQSVAAGEIATDAYANVVYGLVATAGELVRLGQGTVDGDAVRAILSRAGQQPRDAWSQGLAEPWTTLAMAPPVDLPLDDPHTFAVNHGRLLVGAVQHLVTSQDRPLQEAAELDVRLALHLAPAVGASPQAMQELIPAS